MSIALEFIDFIVRRKTIELKYPGGWESCLDDYSHLIGGRVWYDDHLFRDGAMDPTGVGYVVEHWEGMGFIGLSKSKDGTTAWNEVCVVESMFGGPTSPCEWLVCDENSAYLRGTEPGVLVGRSR